jgi:uncharacterized membrane protein
VNQFRDAADRALRDLTNRIQGAVCDGWAAIAQRNENVPDEVLEPRVHAKLGRLVSHPSAIGVQVHNGRVTLSGPVLESEADLLVQGVAAIRGVKEVRNALELHQQAGDVSGLQGGTGRRRRPAPEFLHENWAPGTRLLAGTLGGALLGLGVRRPGIGGLASATVGGLFLARALANEELGRALGIGSRRAIDLQKTIHMAKPVNEVFEFFHRFEDFARFMSHLSRVEKTGEGRYRWTVLGAAAIPVTWNAVVTENIPNKLLAWKSEPGSIVRSAGIVRFDEEREGTRIDVRMSYRPPGGAIGHAVASLFGADPKAAMDDDLAGSSHC